MSTSYSVGIIKGNDDKYEKMRAIYDSCLALDIYPPQKEIYIFALISISIYQKMNWQNNINRAY
jgi:hypothetical protein